MQHSLGEVPGGLAGSGSTFTEGPIPTSSSTASASDWAPQTERQVYMYINAARVDAAANELAALTYQRYHRLVFGVVALLGALAGSKGIQDVGSFQGVWDTIGNVCTILAGFATGLLALLDFNTRAATATRRAAVFNDLATTLRQQMVFRPPERKATKDVFQLVHTTTAQADDMGPPLPPRYRTAAETTKLSMWSARADHTGLYDPSADIEGDPAALRRIVDQQIPGSCGRLLRGRFGRCGQ